MKKQVIKLNESDFRKIVKETVNRLLKENTHSYKGFNCINTSNNPSFPSYEIVSPSGETIGKTLFPSDMKEIVNQYLSKKSCKNINEGESGGWVVEPFEAEEAYNMFAAELGNEEANAAIVRALGNNALSDVLAYLFRMYDFREWENRKTLDESKDKVVYRDKNKGQIVFHTDDKFGDNHYIITDVEGNVVGKIAQRMMKGKFSEILDKYIG